MKKIIFLILLFTYSNVFADIMVRSHSSYSLSDFYGFFILIGIGLYIFFTTKYPDEKDKKTETNNKEL